MHWPALRELLTDVRKKTGLTQVEFAERMGVDKSTVNRVENLYGEATHKPDLETIESWIAATETWTLPRFFEELARRQTATDSPSAETVQDSAAQLSHSEGRTHGAVVPADREAVIDLESLIDTIVTALVTAGSTISAARDSLRAHRPHPPVPGTADPSPASREERAENR